MSYCTRQRAITITYFINVKSNNLDDDNDKCFKTRINFDYHFPSDKTLLIYNLVMHIRLIFKNVNRYDPQVFLEE